MSTRSTGCNEFLSSAELEIPNMVGPKDVLRVEHASAELGPDDIVVEFGPWLGALSAIMGRRSKLHVVDAFRWDKSHARKVPDMAEIGASFRSSFEACMAARGIDVVIHETRFEGFEWQGGAVQLCVIDAPKTAIDLAFCLRAILPHMAPSAEILIKNAATPVYGDMVAYLARLLDEGALIADPQPIDRDVNMLAFKPGPQASEIADIDVEGAQIDAGPLLERLTLAPNHPLLLSDVYQAIGSGDFEAGYAALARMPKERKLVRAWEKIEMKHFQGKIDAIELSTFSEVLAGHCSLGDKPLPVAFHASHSQALRGFWVNNEDKDWRVQAFWPELLMRAQEFGYLNWPSKIREHVFGRDVLDVGCGPGLHGIGFLAAGAKSYVGLDPIIKPDRDRVKNLAMGGKTAFGFTPNQIAERLDNWRAEPSALGDEPEERKYDIAVLHNVTEHLMDLEGIFAGVALRLRPGGRILYNHHNYYSWNGHHTRPKKVDQIDPAEPGQRDVIDWAHVEFDAPAEHYISRGLNRIRLGELEEITERYFDVELSQDMRSGAKVGGGRLTSKIMQRYPYLSERDFQVQNLFCIATVKK